MLINFRTCTQLSSKNQGLNLTINMILEQTSELLKLTFIHGLLHLWKNILVTEN